MLKKFWYLFLFSLLKAHLSLLIRYLTAKVDHAGVTTGRVFTISSASGIITLPIMGFFVIPKFKKDL